MEGVYGMQILNVWTRKPIETSQKIYLCPNWKSAVLGPNKLLVPYESIKNKDINFQMSTWEQIYKSNKLGNMFPIENNRRKEDWPSQRRMICTLISISSVVVITNWYNRCIYFWMQHTRHAAIKTSAMASTR